MARRGRKRAVPVSPMKLKAVHDEDPGEDRRQSLNHKEVERRVAAIQAIGAAEIDSLLSQLRLFRSYLSKEQLESPAKHFFEENLPNLSVIRNEKDKIYELKWRDTERHGDGTKVRDSLDSVAGSHAVSGFHMSVDSARTNFFRAADLHIPDYVPDGSFEHLMLGANDSFQTPGASGSKLSFGTTPKTTRLPKNGELLMSVRGSPLGMYKEENLQAIHESVDPSHEGTS